MCQNMYEQINSKLHNIGTHAHARLRLRAHTHTHTHTHTYTYRIVYFLVLMKLVNHFTTYGRNNLKVTNAQQARIIHRHKNTKQKLLKTNAAIRFNNMCRLKHLTPKYIQIKVNGNSTQSIHTRNAAVKNRINQVQPAFLIRMIILKPFYCCTF
jgi:hypothetical protein